MRNANSQLPRSMILVRALHQPPAPHVSHAEIGGKAPVAFSSEVGTGSREENASTYDGQRCALLTTKSRNTCTRATVFNSSG